MHCSNSFLHVGAALFLLAVSAAIDPAQAQGTSVAPPLEQWLGEWQGTGTNNNERAVLHRKWERTLGGRFVRLTKSGVRTAPGASSPATAWHVSRTPERQRFYFGRGGRHCRPDGTREITR